MIKFTEDTTLNVVIQYDEKNDNIVDECEETFKADEVVEADIINDEGNYADIQFGDGSVAFGVLKSCFVIV